MNITIERLGHLGDGIAQGPIFVPMTLPGEVVEGEVDAGRMAAPKIITPSSDRVRPPCAHFKSCGGCLLQHASDPFLANWKQEVVQSALAAHSITTEFRPIHVSPPKTRRRATLAGTRTKKGALVGFHSRKSDTIIAITECHVLHPDLLAVIPVLEEITSMGTSRSAPITFTLTQSDSGVDCAVNTVKPLDQALQLSLPKFAGDFARLTWNGDAVFTANAPIQIFGTAKVTPPPGAFLQATRDGERALLNAVQDATAGAKKIADLFSGCGTFSLPLAARAAVHAVEGEASMIAALDLAIRHAQGLRPLTLETRDLYRRPLLPDELAAYDAVVVDPPRSGAEAQMKEMARSKIRQIAMVSCSPMTFARDTEILIKAGYRLDWVQVVDQFRWSPHVEVAASLSFGHSET
ncbi:MAG: 23S rRNA (uracil1939-C5)-methyltransferase [Paracoccaceae bacterium]|jgi:23S rRNA (uracil1939-C5)-methyltransferase